MYNEEGNILPFLGALHETLNGLGLRHEIVVVDDGSRDESLARVVGVVDRLPIKLLQLSRNFGKECALTAGLEHAEGDAVILIDADFQHPLSMIERFLEQWRAGYDMVYGIRDREGESALKQFMTHAFYKLINLGARLNIPIDAGDFRLLDKAVVQAICRLPERTRYMKGLYAWVGFRHIGLPFAVQERQAGQSHFNLRRLSSLALTGITAFSDLPLRIWVVIGAFISLVAFAYALWIVASTLLFGNNVPGWATITVGLLFFGGIQLLSIGILGEYLGRIFNEVKQRPNYIVARSWGLGPSESTEGSTRS